MSEKFWYLKNCDLFERLSEQRLKQLELRCRVRKFAPKSPIYLPADAADAVLVLGSGRVKICSFTFDGKQSILTFIEPGEIFGELAILDADQREEYAEAVESSTIILIPAEEVHRLVQEFPDVSLGVTKLIGLRRKRVERRLKYLLFHSNRDRLAHLLLELAEQYGTTTDDGIALRIKLSHQELANIIGSTRETATLMLGELEREGLLKRGRRKIVVTDIEKLAQTVNTSPPSVGGDSNNTHNSPSPAAPVLGRAGRNAS